MRKERKQLLTWDEIVQSYEDHTVVRGKIIMADPNEQYFKVQIGYKEDETPILAILPFSEFSIQNLTLSKTSEINTNTFSLGKDAIFSVGKWIEFYINSIISPEKIYLSRKATQVIPFHNLQEGQEVICTITSINHPFVFVDIGKGIVALNMVQELSSCRYENVANWFNVGEKFPAIITEIGIDKRISVSRKEYFLKHASDYDDIKEDQTRICRIATPIDNGWFVEISPLVFGIMDTKEKMNFKEGEEVICFIKKINNRFDGKLAYHLKFVAKIE